MTAEDYATEQPPTPPPEWMAFGEGALADQAAAAERDWTFGWVRLAEGADLDALRESLAAHGSEVLGQSGDLVRARLPGDLAPLRAIAAANSVAGIGAVPAEQKVTDTLAERALANINDRVPVWITLMEDDPDGRWRSALKDLGADVGRFDAAIRTYAATISLDALVPISQADYVLAVETHRPGRADPRDRSAVHGRRCGPELRRGGGHVLRRRRGLRHRRCDGLRTECRSPRHFFEPTQHLRRQLHRLFRLP